MKIAVIGAGGRLGAALMREYRNKFDLIGFDHQALDLGDSGQLREKIGTLDIDLVINCATFTNVDLCETQRDQAFLINAEAPRVLAEICRDSGAKLIHFSTDYVFDGKKRAPYVESDPADPISVYGESKRAGEQSVLQTEGRHLVVRVSWVFGPDRPSFIDGIIKRAQENEKVDAIADKFSTPTYTLDIAAALPRFFTHATDYGGIVHFANAGEGSWQEYGQWASDSCHEAGLPLKVTTVGARKLKDMANWIARRPVYSVLSTAKYTKLTDMSPRTWRDAVADYITRFYFKK